MRFRKTLETTFYKRRTAKVYFYVLRTEYTGVHWCTPQKSTSLVHYPTATPTCQNSDKSEKKDWDGGKTSHCIHTYTHMHSTAPEGTALLMMLPLPPSPPIPLLHLSMRRELHARTSPSKISYPSPHHHIQPSPHAHTHRYTHIHPMPPFRPPIVPGNSANNKELSLFLWDPLSRALANYLNRWTSFLPPAPRHPSEPPRKVGGCVCLCVY